MTATESLLAAASTVRGPSVPAAALALALLSLGPGAAAALVHDRLPGDDLGGATTLPVASPIGEDADGPSRDAAPAAPSRTASAGSA